MKKKRAMITVDSEQWDRVQKCLEEECYPSGSMSFYLRRCVSELEAYLSFPEEDKGSVNLHPSDAIAELEISRLGFKGAADLFGWDIPDLVKEENEYLELYEDELKNPTEK